MTQPYAARALSQRQAPRVFCIGRNYAKHIEELNNQLPGQEGIIFIKPLSALVPSGESIRLPSHAGAVHYEAELVVEIGQGGRHIDAAQAQSHISAIGLGLDLTLRDVQTKLKHSGEPWEKAKAFDDSAPLASMVSPGPGLDLTDLHFELSIDGEIRQRGHSRYMLIGIAEQIQLISRHWQLLPGDLIFTGTPEGVGPLQPGQHLHLSGAGLASGDWYTRQS